MYNTYTQYTHVQYCVFVFNTRNCKHWVANVAEVHISLVHYHSSWSNTCAYISTAYFTMDQLHVRPKKFNYSRLHMTSYPDYYSLAPLGLLPLISMGKYIKIDSFHVAKCNRYVYVLLPEQQDIKILCAFKRTSI